MNVLIGCEESGTVRDAFAEKGHNAWSCDLKKGKNGGNHFMGDIFEFVLPCKANNWTQWDLFICHPPCTYLTLTANKWLKDQPERKSGALVGEERRKAQHESIIFFKKLFHVPIHRICFENPMGVISTAFRKPDQIIQPFYFGDEARKTTCLWLKNLPKLLHFKQKDLFNDEVTHVDEGEILITKSGNKMPYWYAYADKSKGQEYRAEIRSKTFPGIARAMAGQWG